METTKFIWHNGKLVAWDEARVHVLTHTLHYGGGAFEGIRCYPTSDGPAVFRLREHMERLVYSAGVLQMTLPYSVDQLCDATIELLRENKLPHGYIRPLVYFGYGVMGLNPRNAPVEIAISCWPWGAYLPHEAVDIKTSKYIRIHPRSVVADAKICGHYVNSILAALEVRGTKYHEALFLDADGNVAEGPGENVFAIFGKEIVTPPAGTILVGITRDTIKTVARDLGYTVTEKTLTPTALREADEAFFTGTAAEVVGISSLDDKPIGKGGLGPVSAKIRGAYLDIVNGRDERYRHYLTYINR